MGKKKDKQRQIQQAKLQRKKDKELKIKMRKKMGKGDAFKLSKQYFQYFQAFNRQIEHLRIKLRDVGGDGNCLFRSFSDQIEGNQTSHLLIRDEVCNYLSQNQEFLSPFLDEDEEGGFKQYVLAMRKSGQWGGHLQCQALSQCFKCVIIIHKRNQEMFTISPLNCEPYSLIHLAYFQHEDFEHYTSIRQINDETDLPAVNGLEKYNKNYLYLLHNEQDFIKKMDELKLNEQDDFNELEQELEPYPNYPRNKKCKCGSKIQYKNCCFKGWQIKRSKNY